jgi:hypothetical protein
VEVDLKWFELETGTALLFERGQPVGVGGGSREHVIEILRGLLVEGKVQGPIQVLITKSSSRYH